MVNPHDYTVGWICTISTEYVAAKAMLDEEYDQLECASPRDSNTYTLGKIGRHNVVIAVLPNGDCNTSSAAIVATHMLHSFPNVAFILMVVIGGGAPSTYHDIRLGDIVVGTTRDGRGGVFQCDLGTSTQDRSFKTTGLFHQPPTILRTAVSELMAYYEGTGHRLGDFIYRTYEINPRLRKWSIRPDPRSDRLYQPHFTHLNDGGPCAYACDEDPDQIIQRDEREEDEDNPAIHYGLIASSNQLVRDARIRDALVESHGVLGFDLGSAGVINHFPGLVILGVCNYSDSHPNKEWQRYAAMAAAVYAKDLLSRMSPSIVKDEKSISNSITSPPEETSAITATGFSSNDNPAAQIRLRQPLTREPQAASSPAHAITSPSNPGVIPFKATLTSSWRSLLSCIFHRTTLIVVLILFISLGGMMVAIAIQQTREPSCDPHINTLRADDGFWALLSQLLLQVLSIYCTLYPVVPDREKEIPIAKFWFMVLLTVSFVSAIGAVVVYSWSWKAATLLSFASSFVQAISAGQLAASLDPDLDHRRAGLRSLTFKMEDGHEQ